MGQQRNKIEKRNRRKDYLARLKAKENRACQREPKVRKAPAKKTALAASRLHRRG
jgi:hypothetical protein